MLEIRFFEDACHRLFAQGVVRGSTHLCQGQEGTVVGACDPLRDGDAMLCTYRGHGAVLAMGAPLDRCFGEILGKEQGVCAGKGGSMHLTDASVGALGSFAIIGAHLPIAVGSALAARYRGSDAVTLCFFGDGTANIGAFHEALNLASLWKVPAIFICENNLYGEYSPIAATTSIEKLADRADSYSMTKAQVDGNDLDQVRAAVSEAVEGARAGEGPSFIESLTYRHKGHSRSDPAKYRPDGELEAWLERDPISLYERQLLGAGTSQEELDTIRAEAERVVDDALTRAQQWPEPAPDARFDHVFA
jgi:acetoin:2,6-dichlorophenolindophenol oxidoreductase subunit alpha